MFGAASVFCGAWLSFVILLTGKSLTFFYSVQPKTAEGALSDHINLGFLRALYLEIINHKGHSLLARIYVIQKFIFSFFKAFIHEKIDHLRVS